MAGQDIRGGDQYRSGGGGAALERGGFHGAGVLPVWNNMVGQMDYIRAGVLTLSQEFGLPGGRSDG